MRSVAISLFAILLLSLLVVSAASAAAPAGHPPVGGCLPGWELHMFMDHEDHPDHHIGLAQDLNGDGWICMRMLSEDLHLHMDNVIR